MGKKSLSPTFNIHSTFTNVHVHLPSMTLLRNRKIEVTIFAQLPTATLEEIHRPAQGNYRSIWHLNRNTVNVLLETISGSHLFTCWPLAWASFEKTQVHNMPSGLMHGAKNGKKVTWPVTWILQVITKNDHKCLTLHKACERHSFLTTILLSEYTRIIYIHIYVCIYIHIQVKQHTFLRSIDLWTISPPAGNAKTRHHTWSRCKKRAWGNLRPFGSPLGINISFLISSLNGPKFQIKEVHGFKMVTHVHRSLCHSWFQCVRPCFFHPTTSRQIMADGKPTIWQPPHHASTKTRAAWPHGLLLEGFWANLWVFVKFRPEAFTGKKEHYTDWYAVESARYPDRPNTGSSRFWHTYTYTFCLKTTRLHDRELHKLHLLPWNPLVLYCPGKSHHRHAKDNRNH